VRSDETTAASATSRADKLSQPGFQFIRLTVRQQQQSRTFARNSRETNFTPGSHPHAPRTPKRQRINLVYLTHSLANIDSAWRNQPGRIHVHSHYEGATRHTYVRDCLRMLIPHHNGTLTDPSFQSGRAVSGKNNGIDEVAPLSRDGHATVSPETGCSGPSRVRADRRSSCRERDTSRCVRVPV
jgi:hypothetical protein